MAPRASARNSAQGRVSASVSGTGRASRATSRSNGASGPAVPAVPAPLAIRRLLAVNLAQVNFQTLIPVITERHMQPPNLSVEQLALEHAKACCFDAAGAASPSWTKNELCDSCTLYNQFTQGESG